MAQLETGACPGPDPATSTLSSAHKPKGSFLTPPITPAAHVTCVGSELIFMTEQGAAANLPQQ